MICPNCGAQLPDTATMCHVCKVYFKYESSTYYGNQVASIEQPRNLVSNRDDDKTLYYFGMIIGILSGCLILLSAFMPFLTSSAYIIKQSVSLSELSNYYAIEVGVLFVGLILDSLFQHGKSNIAVGVIIFLFAIYRYNQYLELVNESDMAGTVHLGAGFYMILISGIFAVISGVLLICYNKQ